MAWRELGKPWHDTTVDYCEVCGNLLIRRFYELTVGGRTVRACCEEDERLAALLDRYRCVREPTPLRTEPTFGSSDPSQQPGGGRDGAA